MDPSSVDSNVAPPASRPEVDVVYTWVDGSDPKHKEARNKHLGNKPGNPKTPRPHVSSVESCRWRNSGEIAASIRSVLTFAPWVRNIVIVCSLGQSPQLDIDPKEWEGGPSHEIIVVQDETICPVVPVFNSHAIEANLHRIPGLADRFIYFCDDMFIGAPTLYATFYDPVTHRPRVFIGNTQLSAGPNFVARKRSGTIPAWYAARVNNFANLNQKFGRRDRRDLIHQARPLSKEIAEATWKCDRFSALLSATSKRRFRSAHDVEPTGLFSWVGIETKKCVMVDCAKNGNGPSHKYFGIGDKTNLEQVAIQLHVRDYELYCLNDTMVTPAKRHSEKYGVLLRSRLPHHKTKYRRRGASAPPVTNNIGGNPK